MEGQSPPSPPIGLSEMRNPKRTQGEATSPADPEPGTLKFRGTGTSYVQSVHWEAILTKVKGLKEELVTDGNAPSCSQFFYGQNRHATRDEILAAVPARPVVDRLMAVHFDSYMITPC